MVVVRTFVSRVRIREFGESLLPVPCFARLGEIGTRIEVHQAADEGVASVFGQVDVISAHLDNDYPIHWRECGLANL